MPKPNRPKFCRSCGSNISHLEALRLYCDDCRTKGLGGQDQAQQDYRKRIADRKKDWCSENRAKLNARSRKSTRAVRLAAINHYGGKCACCGEGHLEFLAIDHINGGGRKHLEHLGIGGGSVFARWLRDAGWPEGYRVLCHNCNNSLGFYGYCPHHDRPDVEPQEDLSSLAGDLGPATGERNGAYTKPEKRRHGETNGNSKLTAEIVSEIRKSWDAGCHSTIYLARKFGVSKSTIERIINRKLWAHID